jgi:hypothetical protein
MKMMVLYGGDWACRKRGVGVYAGSFFGMMVEAVAQLEKNNPIVENTKYFCLLTNFQRDFRCQLTQM